MQILISIDNNKATEHRLECVRPFGAEANTQQIEIFQTETTQNFKIQRDPTLVGSATKTEHF